MSGQVRASARAAATVAVALLAFAAGVFLARARPTRADLRDLVTSRAPALRGLDGLVDEAAAAAGVDADLLRGLVAAESSGDPRARSGKGAVGLVQLLPATAEEQARAIGLDPARIDLEDPATNLRLGAAYLARLLRSFDGAESFALAAYNAGATKVRRWRLRAVDADAAEAVRREGYAETRRHVARALSYRDAYRAR